MEGFAGRKERGEMMHFYYILKDGKKRKEKSDFNDLRSIKPHPNFFPNSWGSTIIFMLIYIL